jgi:hypothetical protein
MKYGQQALQNTSAVSTMKEDSGSMESSALVDMMHRLYTEFRCCVSNIVTDDYSTMWSQMRWSNLDYLKHYSLKKVPKELNSNCNPVYWSNKGKLLYTLTQNKDFSAIQGIVANQSRVACTSARQ